jgi:hypothetical protein
MIGTQAKTNMDMSGHVQIIYYNIILSNISIEIEIFGVILIRLILILDLSRVFETNSLL